MVQIFLFKKTHHKYTALISRKLPFKTNPDIAYGAAILNVSSTDFSLSFGGGVTTRVF